jgi:hypothetical protein
MIKNEQLTFIDNIVDESHERKFANIKVSVKVLHKIRQKRNNSLESYDYTVRKMLGLWLNKKHLGSPPKCDIIPKEGIKQITVSKELLRYLRSKRVGRESYNSTLERLLGLTTGVINKSD